MASKGGSTFWVFTFCREYKIEDNSEILFEAKAINFYSYFLFLLFFSALLFSGILSSALEEKLRGKDPNSQLGLICAAAAVEPKML